MGSKDKKDDDDSIRTAAEIALEMAGEAEIEDMPTPEPSEPKLVDPEEEAFRDKYLRVRADLENIQRRMRTERETMRLNTLSNFLRELLPVIDNFDRALETTHGEETDLAKGLMMTRQLLDKVLADNNVAKISNEGLFDANKHEAITSLENTTVPENTIQAVIEQGYTIGERVIRYSKVQVTTGGPQPEPEADAES